jgi:hypothetical protein
MTLKRRRPAGARKSAKRCSPKWAAFKRKHVKPGMSKAAYKEAVRKHWKPEAKAKCKPARRVKRRAVRKVARKRSVRSTKSRARRAR